MELCFDADIHVMGNNQEFSEKGEIDQFFDFKRYLSH